MNAAVVGQIKQSNPAKKTLRSSLQDTIRNAAGHVKSKASRDALSDLSALRAIRHDKGKEKESALSAEHVGEERSTFMRRFSSKPKVIKAPDPSSSRVPSSPAVDPPPRPPKDPTWSRYQPPTLSQATFSTPTLRSPPPVSMDALCTPHNGSTSTLVTTNAHRPLTRRPPISGPKLRLASPSTPSLIASNSSSTVRRTSQRRSTHPSVHPSTPSPSLNKPVKGGSQALESPAVKSHSSTHLPLVQSSSSTGTTSPTPSPSKFRRNSSNAHASDTRTTSPTPSSSSGFAQNKFSTSTPSLLLPLSPQREAIRTAASFVLKESLRPPADLGPLTKQWIDEMESRTRALARLERTWIASNGTGTISGEERERKAFCEALRDGYVLCQILNKWKPNIISRIDHREDGITKHSNITRFVSVAGMLGVTSDILCSRDDFIASTPDSMMRVAQTILTLSKLVDFPSSPKVVPRSPYEGKDKGPSIPSSPNLTATSPTKKRMSPPGPSGDIPSPSPAPPPSRPGLRPLILAPAASRISLASSATTDSIAHSSLLYDKHSGFGSIRTNVTEATTMVPSSGVPSLSRSDAKNAAIELERAGPADLLANAQSLAPRRRYSDKKPNGLQVSVNDLSDVAHEPPPTPTTQGRRDRRSSEAATDLMRVTEETESDGLANLSPGTSVVNEPLDSASNIRLGKGKWPDDFMAVFSASPPNSPDIHARFTTSSPEPQNRKISFRSSAPVPSPITLPDFPSVGSTNVDRQMTHGASSPRLPRAGGRVESQPSSPGSPSNHEASSSALEPISSGFRRRNTRGHLVPKMPSNSQEHSVYRTKFLNASTPSIMDSAPTGSAPIPIPFPRRTSLDPKYPGPHGPSISSPRLDALAASSDTLPVDLQREMETSSAPPDQPLSRARHYSHLKDPNPVAALERSRSGVPDDLKLGRRSRFASMMDISNPDQGGNESTIRQTLIVKEDGTSVTHYQLGNCIGRGQFGSVYRALNLNTGQMVAVKQIRLDGLPESEVTQLMKEVDLLKRLSHPSIVKYEGMSRDADNLSIVLEYAENGSLGQTLKAFGKLNERLVAGYVTKILEGLHYLHSSQVVHCDLKAANILTTKNGNVKLTDFGVSLNLHAMENIKSDVAGTPNWMAPEVIELKGASTASDIWSLGCTIIELLTGKPPYTEIQNGLSVMFHIVEDPSPPLPRCSPALKDFFSLCFSKDPTKRPSAELLFEHPWLKNNWGEHKELRPQDSIPFLKRVSADLQRTNLAHQISFAESSTPPVTTTPAERQHTFVKTNFSAAVDCRVCYTPLKRSAMLCQWCGLICHSRCIAEAPVNCDPQEQMRIFVQHQQQQPSAEPQARSPTNLSSTSSPAEGGLPLSFPHIIAGFRKLRHSASSVPGDQFQAVGRSEGQRPHTSRPGTNSVRTTSSGNATTTTADSRFSTRVSLHLRESASPVAGTSPQRVVATPSPARLRSLDSTHKRGRKKSKYSDQGKACLIQ